MPAKERVFLSHSGLDADHATELASRIERELATLGYDVEVFNTSEPEHRFRELHPRDAWEDYDEELRRYLEDNLQNSAAFLAYVTPKSLATASDFIKFEIEVARTKALESQASFFFPCVAQGAGMQDLPEGAMEFQGLDLATKDGLRELSLALVRVLTRSSNKP